MIEALVEQIEARFAELSALIVDADVISDRNRYAQAGREYRRIEPAHELAVHWRRAVDDAAGARELIAEDGDDPELREMLRGSEERIAELEDRMAGLEGSESLGERGRDMMRHVMPAEASRHFRNAGREQLLGFRSILDFWIRRIESAEARAASADASPQTIDIE